MKDNSHFSETQNTGVQHAGLPQGRVVDWQYQTIEELRLATPVEEQMIVSILAAAWRPEASAWDKGTLRALLVNFARDTNTATEHRIIAALQSIESGAAVVESLASAQVIGTLTSDALRIAIAKRQLAEFLSCWQSRPLTAGVLSPIEQTFVAKLTRLVVTGFVILNVVLFLMLFIIPEFQKMFQEFGIEMTAAAQFLMRWADRFAKLWFIPFFLMLILGFFFFRGASFGSWWRRWSTGTWTARDWHKKDQRRLSTAWELRPAGPVTVGAGADASEPVQGKLETLGRWEQPASLKGVLTKSESAALSMTEDQDLKDWLLEKMIISKQRKRARTSNLWATILLGAGHCFLGLVVLLAAISVFGSLLEIIYGLAGGRP